VTLAGVSSLVHFGTPLGSHPRVTLASSVGAAPERVICADQVGRPEAAPRASGQWVAFNSEWNRYT
jgi:hypothetical protein